MSRQKIFTLFMLAALLAACSGSNAPRRIASYPAGLPYLPPATDPVVVYDAHLELETGDVERAAGLAARLAGDLGGYLAGSQFWIQDGLKFAFLELAVPSGRFDDLRRGLYGLGALVDERGTGRLADARENLSPAPFSQVKVLFRSESAARPPLALVPGWNPALTIRRALDVSLAIFRFLVDLLIWVVVVAGPFALLFWSGRALFRRLRRP